MIRAMEEAALNSWPALQQVLYDGWVLRFAGGYTKRANSVNPLYASHGPTLPKIDHCEALYRERGMPPIFRLTPFAPDDLDGILDARGYRLVDPTLVLQRELSGAAFPDSYPVDMRSESLEEWMAVFCRLTGSATQTHQTHSEMLQRIVPQRLLATLRPDGGDAVACALAVQDGNYVGIFDLIVDVAQRGRGYGTALMAGLLQWGLGEGASVAYLQVVEENTIARRLYTEKLGFEKAYRYWYRVSTEW